MKWIEVDGDRKCACPPKCDDCDERFTCLEAGPLLPRTKVNVNTTAPWPDGFSITMTTNHVHKQTGWLFVTTAGSRPDNMVQLTSETEGLGTITWQGTAQQFLREFMKAEQHAIEQAARQRDEEEAASF